MRRREFNALLAGTVASTIVRPLVARAQQAASPVIGFISARSPDDSVRVLSAFHQGLTESGFTVGRNVAVEYRWARGQYSSLPALAAELVQLPVAVLVGVAAAPSAAKQATSTIPIVFVTGDDPVKAGLVKSINRPGENVTGSVILGLLDMEPKKLGLLRELVPGILQIGALIDSNFRAAARQEKQLNEAALRTGQRIFIAKASDDADLDAAFEALIREQVGALLIAGSPYFDTRQNRIIAIAARHRLSAMYHFAEFAVAGGLISYGPSFADAYRQAGLYTGRILKGAKPADLPVVQSAKFELVINRKTAKALGLEIPLKLLAIADEIID